jgi:hypothetical protein
MDFLLQPVHSLLQAIKQRLRQWTKPDNRASVLDVALDLTRSKSELMIENALLRRQLAVLNRQVKRPQLTWRDRSIIVFLASKLRGWKDALMIVQPETLLRWHRDF